jgi:hypothetical protein
MRSDSVAVPRNKTQLLRYLQLGMEFEMFFSRTVTRGGEIVDLALGGPTRRRVNKVQTNAVSFTGPGHDGQEFTPEHPVWLMWTKSDRWEFADDFWAVVKECEGRPGERVTVRVEFRYR